MQKYVLDRMMIVIENLTKDFDSGFSLKNITLAISKGEKVSLFGPNGAYLAAFDLLSFAIAFIAFDTNLAE